MWGGTRARRPVAARLECAHTGLLTAACLAASVWAFLMLRHVVELRWCGSATCSQRFPIPRPIPCVIFRHETTRREEPDWHDRAGAGKAGQKKQGGGHTTLTTGTSPSKCRSRSPRRPKLSALRAVARATRSPCKPNAPTPAACNIKANCHNRQAETGSSGGTHRPKEACDGPLHVAVQQRRQAAIRKLLQRMRPSRLRCAPKGLAATSETWPIAKACR